MSAGQYKAYPEYNLCDTAVQRFKPKHWRGMQVKHALRSTSSSGSAIKGSVSSEEAEGLYPAFSASGQDVWTPQWAFNEPGIVLSAVGARCGKCFKADGRWAVVANTHVFLMNDGMDRNFFWYLVNSEDFWQKGGSAQPYVQVPASLSQRIGTPPLSEQIQIAKFLDHETAKIDRLIEKQEELIRLLKEKRQAVISHAVTKGLNPHAPLTPSGIPWLAQIPAHWNIKPLKYLMSLTSGGTPSKDNVEYWDGTIPWASSKDLKLDELFDTQDHITQKALDKGAAELVQVGSILTVVRGMILLHTFPVSVTRVPMAINQDLKAIRPDEGITADFLAWLLRGASEFILSCTDEAGHGTKVLRMETWLATQVPVPPLEEQASIVSGIVKRLGQLDDLTKDAHRAITLLQERRTALISAAVTGKIDVRHWQPPVNSENN